MKFYQKRGFALVVLVLAILGSCVYGISKKPADLPQVSYGAAGRRRPVDGRDGGLSAAV